MDPSSPSQGDPGVVRAQDVHQVPSQPIIIQQQQGSWFGRLGKLLLVALGICILTIIGQAVAYRSYFTSGEKIQEKYLSGSRSAADKVAVIRLEGTILKGDGFVKRQIDLVRDDPDVRAVVLRVDSPGGTVTASDYLYHHLKKMTEDRDIPLVVSMGGLCASGGYYVSMAVGGEKDSIFAEPTTWTGSIGVIIPRYDLSGMLESWHVKDDSIASHKFKELMSMTKQRSPKETAEVDAILHQLVASSFDDFKDKVRDGRPKFRDDEKALDDVATGQIFTASQALDNGLIDKIGFLEDAVDRAAELAKLDKDNVRVVKYKALSPSIIEFFAGSNSQAAAGWDLQFSQILELAEPRAYYLCTWMPAGLLDGEAQ